MRKIPKALKRKQVYVALRPEFLEMLENIPEDKDYLYDRLKPNRRSERIEAALLEHFQKHYPQLWKEIQNGLRRPEDPLTNILKALDAESL